MNPLIDVRNIKYNVPGKSILSIDDLLVFQGEILGIMGPNGAGKSTLLSLLSFLKYPSEGNIYYNNVKITKENVTLDLRRKFALAMQQSLLLNTTVFQNVAIGLKIRKMPKKIICEKVNYWLDKFNILHLANKHAYHLSGGEAQRVNLARALVLEPEVLFLDEPFSALDFPTKVQLLKDLKTILTETKTTIVFVSHDLMEIKYFTERLAIIMDGQIVQIGDSNEVLENPNQLANTFISNWNILNA